MSRYEHIKKLVTDALEAERAWLAEQEDAELNDILATYSDG